MEKKEKILIVDDNKTTLKLLEELFAEYNILTAESGERMKEILTNSKPEVILLDVVMPDENGFDIAEELRQNSELADIPIIFVTAKDTDDDVVKGFDSGGYDYIKKPFSIKEIKSRVKAVLLKSKKQQKLKDESAIDTLTKILNKSYFFKRSDENLELYKRQKMQFISLSIVDIDFFENINETLGHKAGDNILKDITQIIQQNIRPFDLLARYEAEKFIILFFDCNKNKAKEILTRISENISETVFKYENKATKVTFSSGVADTTDFLTDNLTINHLVKIAFDRLYIAKNTGRHKIITES